MPRTPRLDAPGALHHIIARGIERCDIFRSDADRHRFVDRLARLLDRFPAGLYAWCLLSNHFHLLLRTGGMPLSSFLRRLLTGHAVTFNRLHQRSGHLFQNRFKSILVEEEAYLLELVRYIHLNPVRAGIVTIEALDRYPWTGHATLLGYCRYPVQDTEFVLGHFGPTRREACRAYAAFLRAGIEAGPALDLDGGGLHRSLGGWEHVDLVRRGRERWTADERILGTPSFVQDTLARQEEARSTPRNDAGVALPIVLTHVAGRYGISPTVVASPSKHRAAVSARALFSFAAVRGLGVAAGVAARHLGVSTQSVLRGLEIAEELLEQRGWTLRDLLPPAPSAQRGAVS